MFFTAYKATKVVNKKLDDYNIKNIPPQMIYNYVGKGYIQHEVVNNQKVIHEDVLNIWIDKYINKKLEAIQESNN